MLYLTHRNNTRVKENEKTEDYVLDMANTVMAAWVYPEGTVGGGGQCPLFGRSEVEGKAFKETFLSEACLLIMKNFSC